MSKARLVALLGVVVGLASVPAGAAASSGPLSFVEDDYPKALELARARKLPIFLDAWAPWCHSCRSMKAYVFTDAKLAPYADRFVWISIDTEKAVNAPTTAKFPVGAWPSMYVIDPATETVTHRWTGTATIAQLTKFLDEALPAAAAPPASNNRGAPDRPAVRDDLGVALARADKLNGAAAWDSAADAYAAILAHAPDGWSSYARVADAYLFALVKADRDEECARAARGIVPKLKGLPASGSSSAMGLDCALGLDPAVSWRGEAIAELESAARVALADTSLGLAADDRSGIYISLLGARQDAKDEAGAKRVAADWIALLEEAAAKAPNPDARAVFDAHRLSAYLEIGEPARAVPMLEASERDLPADYNPPARLAVALQAMKQYDRALAASDRALAKAYGPRRLGILRTRSKIQAEMGAKAEARATLEGALAEAEALPESQRSAGMIAALRRDLDALAKPAAS
jgi:thioredoxin-like negative regulator of GroEL